MATTRTDARGRADGGVKQMLARTMRLRRLVTASAVATVAVVAVACGDSPTDLNYEVIEETTFAPSLGLSLTAPPAGHSLHDLQHYRSNTIGPNEPNPLSMQELLDQAFASGQNPLRRVLIHVAGHSLSERLNPHRQVIRNLDFEDELSLIDVHRIETAVVHVAGRIVTRQDLPLDHELDKAPPRIGKVRSLDATGKRSVMDKRKKRKLWKRLAGEPIPRDRSSDRECQLEIDLPFAREAQLECHWGAGEDI